MLETANSAIHIASTIVPLHNDSVLLPNACIDEIFKVEHIKPIKQKLSWCPGFVDFKGEIIMLISLENIENKIEVSLAESNIAIKIKKTEEFSNLPNIAILAANTPHTLQASDYSLDKEYSPSSTHPLARCYVNIKEKQSFIPDLPRLYTEFASQIQDIPN